MYTGKFNAAQWCPLRLTGKPQCEQPGRVLSPACPLTASHYLAAMGGTNAKTRRHLTSACSNARSSHLLQASSVRHNYMRLSLTILTLLFLTVQVSFGQKKNTPKDFAEAITILQTDCPDSLKAIIKKTGNDSLINLCYPSPIYFL